MSSRVIKVITWNINGIQNPVKRFKVLSHLKSMDCDIVILQETHLTKEETLKLKQRWVGQIFYSSGTKASRGFCILISKRILLTALEVISDKEGQWVIVSGDLQNNKITLVYLYAPNLEQANFVSLLNIQLAQFKNTPLLVTGDFNLVNDA